MIRIISPFPAGGATDILARYLAPLLADKLGTKVLVENKPGASSTIGSDYVAKSPPDGSVLLLAATHFVINPSLFRKLPYDTLKDFAPIAEVATSPNVLVVNKDFPIRSIGELIATAKRDPGKLSFGSTGIGGANHLTGELLKQRTGIDLVHIPYKGEAPSLNDLIGGHIPMMFGNLLTLLPAIESGTIRAIGVAGMKREPTIADVPTFDESGVKDFETSSWFGLYMPAGNDAVAARMSTAMAEILASPEARAKFPYRGGGPGRLTGEAFRTFVAEELTKWGTVVRTARIEQE
jgi:tripartite-type tricarboxylate transporter receptor subunit TctC